MLRFLPNLVDGKGQFGEVIASQFVADDVLNTVDNGRPQCADDPPSCALRTSNGREQQPRSCAPATELAQKMVALCQPRQKILERGRRRFGMADCDDVKIQNI